MDTVLNKTKEFLDTVVTKEIWYQDVKPFIEAIVLYGSVAKGTNRPDSDIDLLFILPRQIEEKFTTCEYFFIYEKQEFNIVMRSIEKLRTIAKGKHDTFQAEIFRSSLIIQEKNSEVRDLIHAILYP